MMTIALIVLGSLLFMCLICSPSKTIFRLLWTLVMLPLLMGYALRLRKTEPSALADAWNEWRADFARGHL